MRAAHGLLCVICALAPREAVAAFREYIPLRAVQVLTLHAERPTRARREPERPQLACGGSACALWNQTVRIAPPIEASARAFGLRARASASRCRSTAALREFRH